MTVSQRVRPQPEPGPNAIHEPINVFERQKYNHETGRDPGSAQVAVERRDLAVDSLPICEPHHLALHIEDLLESSPDQIV